jgi:undecaprenyl-diphosphatase
MPTTVQAALLGIVQGLTEFLPVSSSAHLILARAFFGFDGEKFGLPFDVACHVGTLLAVLVFFRAEIAGMVTALPRIFAPAQASGPQGPNPAKAGRHAEEAGRHVEAGRGKDEQRQYARLIWLLIIGTIPAILVGLAFNAVIEERLRTPQVAAVTLGLGALGFFAAERVGAKRRDDASLTMMEAFWIGCAQAVALVPGVSRSGATITLGLFLGLRRAEAARFIFLLAIPAILAAAAHEAPKVLRAGLAGETGWLFLIGVVTSALVGYLAVKYFIRYLGRHTLDGFAWYRLALAASVVVWLFTRGAGL